MAALRGTLLAEFTLVFFLLLCPRVVWAADVQPDDPSSHAAFLKLLNASRDHTRHDILGRYDAYLARSPNDHLTAIERCKFVAQSLEEDEEDPEPDRTSCSDDLERGYG